MPEGDAVWRTCRRLDEGLAGRRITDWQLRWPTVAGSDRRGATTREVVPRGKHILHRLDDGWTLHTHLRMEGAWQVRRPTKVRRADLTNHELRALVGCRDATALGFRLGMMDLVPTAREADVVGPLGPDLLGGDWDADVAVANLLAQPERPVAAALLDQRNLAGIGTIWNAETLFLERVWPWTPIVDLGADGLRGVVERAHHLLHETLQFEWSTSTGDPHEPTFAHSRDGRPCRRCRTRIRLDFAGEAPRHRFMYWCPTCQAGPPPPSYEGITPGPPKPRPWLR